MSEDRERLEEDYRGTLTKLGDELTKKSIQRLVFLFPKITRAEAAELQGLRYDDAASELFRLLEDNEYLSLINVDTLRNTLKKISLLKAATILEKYKRRNENLINAELQRQHEENQRQALDNSNSSSAPNSPVKGARSPRSDAQKKIFISFSFKILKEVTALKDRIERRIGKDSCWMCTTGIRGGDTMYRKITQAIVDADIILCMINQDFANSSECEKEVLLASKKKKHIIPVMLEKFDWKNLETPSASSIQLVITPLLYFNLYDQTMKEDEFKKLVETIEEKLGMGEQGASGDGRDCAGQSNPGNTGEPGSSGSSSSSGIKRSGDGDCCDSSKKQKTE